MTIRFMLPLTLLATLPLAGCEETGAVAQDLEALREPDLVRSVALAPPGAEPGTCWGREVSPATIETVTEQVMVQPAEVMDDGTVISPAIFRSETRQKIVKERRETWFQTPCEDVWTEEFTSSVQRALAARGFYHGAVTGVRDKRTLSAIRRFQSPQGLDSSILSLEAARSLGLVAVERDKT